ncbi:MAG: NAD(P)/FAD-dependent oxidoreductase [Pseudomonadota bacterium]
MQRREFVKWISTAAAAATLPGCATSLPNKQKSVARVAIIGAGFAGVAVAKYLRLWSPDIEVVLIDPNIEFVSRPLSNRVLAGSLDIADLTRSYDALIGKYGVRMVRDQVTRVDMEKRRVLPSRGGAIPFDRLVVAPGIDLMYESISGVHFADAPDYVPHGWVAGRQTTILREQLEAMPDGGTYALSIPQAPYSCLPAPYERACQIAHYFKRNKPKAKVLVLDANENIAFLPTLFARAWEELYPGMVEYRPNMRLVEVDVRELTARFQSGAEIKANVLNVIPPQAAAGIARDLRLLGISDRWCEVDFRTYESIRIKGIHVVGDAVMGPPTMLKTAHVANQQAKICAAALIAILHGDPYRPTPVLTDACYSFVSDKEAIHWTAVYQYDSGKKTMVMMPESAGTSTVHNAEEARHASSWLLNILDDTLG